LPVSRQEIFYKTNRNKKPAHTQTNQRFKRLKR
jgi:hypothetical protein